MLDHVTHTLEAIYNNECTMLVLNAIPSPISREKNFYYEHPRDRFWQVLSAVFDEPLPFSTEDKTRLVLKHGIALWNVLESCDMNDGDENSIKKPVAHDFSVILREAPITKIFTVGDKAYKLYNLLAKKQTNIDAIKLPSTSPEYMPRYPLNTLIDFFMVLRTGMVYED
ncbi:MAG: DNA-deoxyinosine glycosylase [Spirochaetaceae bacterium]|jgi:hypoxanthine-DNA glycosylase|nr:DNA-deoxyinosine glycosylase [Spirochaetaceae bacterium]